MKSTYVMVVLIGVVPLILGVSLPRGGTQDKHVTQESPTAQDTAVSYKEHVTPILQKYCLPCHAEESYNPSELSLDSYALLKKGGKHGATFIDGKPEESLLIQKLADAPPFGDRMPLQSRRKKTQTPPKKLTEEEMKVLEDWIVQGGKDN
jgi:hypothetical protein